MVEERFTTPRFSFPLRRRNFPGKISLMGDRFHILCGGARFDVSSPGREGIKASIYSAVKGGKKVKLLKILLDNRCENNCLYCIFRKSSPVKRRWFSPEELARIFFNLYQRGEVEGIFLSSAVGLDPDKTQERMVRTVEILREKFHFQGYVHLKILPHVHHDLWERAVYLADRVSINLEAPSPKTLAKIAPDKRWDNLSHTLEGLSKLSLRFKNPSGVTTQFVVGPGGEKDREILSLTEKFYRVYKLRRVYYRSFEPLPFTPLERFPPTPLLREIRLYQADYLIRRYQFRVGELVNPEGYLPLHIDPKLYWAMRNPHLFPVEINQADYFTLMRVPGIGERGARRIIQERRKERIRDVGRLRALRICVDRAIPFILLDGRRVVREKDNHLLLWNLQEVRDVSYIRKNPFFSGICGYNFPG